MRHRRYSGFTRPEQSTIRVDTCREKSAIAGIAIAGCMIAGKKETTTNAIPTSTFNIGDPIG